MTDFEIIDEIEKIRSKNNINWMNLLRLAFRESPEEAREIVSKINMDDNKISELLKKLSLNNKQNG
jgi:Spy/CpxP family protein refolding chaperone